VWDYNEFAHYELKYMKFTLPSDSTLREDIIALKAGKEEEAGKAKVRLEEFQRKDRKLRSAFSGKDH
jgi:hypothetical protein